MYSATVTVLLVTIVLVVGKKSKNEDISIISQYWGQLTPYHNNPDNYFGVKDIGLPHGCQVEQVHVLHRHGGRYPTSAAEDGGNTQQFGKKVAKFKTHYHNPFSGPLSFLNTWTYRLGLDLLVPTGASQAYASGTSFWNQYGRILYDADVGQAYYNPKYPDGTRRPKPVLRTTSQERILDSALDWADGFFGPGSTNLYKLVIIPEGGVENNTLASYDLCTNANVPGIGNIGDTMVFKYIPLYLKDTTTLLQKYISKGFHLTTNDTYAMQSLCAYEYTYLGSSSFCSLFTLDDWKGFLYTLNLEYYYDYAWGNPTGRAQGIGYLQELLARLNHRYIKKSHSSVNSTLDSRSSTFPLDQPFYLDMSHDDILISVVTAMSIDYFKQDLPSDAVPPPKTTFNLSHLTPFAARLHTELIGCNSDSPKANNESQTQYTPTQYGYDPDKATHKFIRMRWNNGIIPIDTIRGDYCTGRTDGLCSLKAFLKSQAKASDIANFDYACFGSYTLPSKRFKNDGTIFKK